jgi:Histidine kinase
MRFARPASLRPITVDAAVAGAFFVATLAGALVEGLDPTEGVIRRVDALSVLLIAGMTLPLAARRLLPRAVAIATVGCVATAAANGYPIGIGPFAALFALCSLAITTSRGDTLLVGIPAGIALVTGFVVAPGPASGSNVVGNLLVVAFTLLVGDLLRVRRDQNALLAERNRELEALREAQTRSAIVEERIRIAREVHDVVGHSLVAITLQARAGLRRLTHSPERTGQALREIETLASRALEETRTAVATIRSGTDVTALHPSPRWPTSPTWSSRCAARSWRCTWWSTRPRTAWEPICRRPPTASCRSPSATPPSTPVRLAPTCGSPMPGTWSPSRSPTTAATPPLPPAKAPVCEGCASAPSSWAAPSKRARHRTAAGVCAPASLSSASPHEHPHRDRRRPGGRP